MAYEFNDLKGFLLLVLLTIPLTTTTNINCNEKPFYCVNATHFMICVDLGNGVSSTIDDFVIPCPPTTVCHPNNRFECEFPHIEVTPPTINVIGVSAIDEKNVVPPLIDSVTTTAQIQETTSPPIEQNLPPLEEVMSPKLIELLENFKEEYTNGNEPFFDVTTILPSNAESSNGISTKKIDKNNIVTDSDTVYDARSTTETTTPTDNNTEVLLTDNSLAAETTTPVAELFDSMSKNNLEMNITTHQLRTAENLQDGDNLHVTTTTFTPLIDTEQNFDLNVTSDNMIPVNHTNYQRSFQNNIASPNLKLSNASVVTINTISTTEGVPEITTNYVEPTTMPDNPQTMAIQDTLRLEGKYMLTTDATGKSDDYIKILSNQAFSEEKSSIHQGTIGTESITYEPLKVSNKTIEVDSNNSFVFLAPLEKQETPYNFVRDDSLPERVTEASFLAKIDVTDFIMTTENTDKATNVELTTTPDNPQTTTIQDNLRPEEKYMLNTDAPGKSDDHIKILSNQTFGKENASVCQDKTSAELLTYEPLEVTNKAAEVESNNSFILSAPLTKEETPFNSVRDDSLPGKDTEPSFLSKPDVTNIIITTENTNKASNIATEALSITDSIITVKIDIETKNSEDLEMKSITGTFLDDAKLYQDASKSNVTSNMKLDNAKEIIVNSTIGFDETTNNMVYTRVSAIEPSTGVTDEHESETINILNWQDKETTTFRSTVLNNDQYAGIASTIPMSYSISDVYKTTPNPLDEKLSSTSSYGTTKDSSSNVLKLETVDNVLNISIPLLNEASGTVPSLEPINTADILYEADAKSIIQTAIVDINNYESNNSTEPVDGHTPIDEVKISSMHPTAITEKIDTTYKNSEDVTFIPQYTNTIDENNKKYYEETTNKVQNDFIINQAETPTSPTYAIEQGNIDLVRPENVPNLIIPTNESSSTDLIKQGDSKASEIHTSISNNYVTTERSNTDINKTKNILFPSTLPINETHTKDIKDILLTSATAASQTESNQVSEHDTEYKRNMGAIEVDYTPSLITIEPSNVKVTNEEDTKMTYNCSSNMLLILPQEDKVLITQAKGNNAIITDQNDGTNDIKYATLTQIQNNTSEKNIEQNVTHSLRTGEYIPKPNKNNENVLETTLAPMILTSRSKLHIDENVVKLKEALSDPSTENPLFIGTEFINYINSLKITTDEVLTTTEAYDLYPKYDVTTKYSNMNEEDNTATLKNDINLKVSSNIKTDNPMSGSIITTKTNMGNREPNSSSGYDTILTSATTASSFAYNTESNQVSERESEFKRIMGPVDVDYTPSLTIGEPNNIKVTNVEDAKYSKINEEGNPASLRNDMNLKVFSNIKTDNQMSNTKITTETYIDNRESNPSSGYKTKPQTVQSDETLTTPKVIVATIEKSIPIRIPPAVVVPTDKDSISNINTSFNKQTSSIIDPKVKQTKDPTNTITHYITKPTVIIETVAEPTLDDVILTEFMLANDIVNKNQLHLQNMSYSNITAHKEALHKSRLNMTFNSEKSANLSNREVMDLENGNNTLMATEINIEIDGNKNQNDISIEDKYESSTTYFEIPSRIEITAPNPLIHQEFKIFVNDVEHKHIIDAAGSAGFHLTQKGNESISSSSMIESKVKTTSGNESKYNYSSLNNRTYKVLITDKEQSNDSQASGNNKTNIGVSNSLGNITEQQNIINDKVVTSYVQTHIINNKITNLVNNESNATISKTKDFSTSINLNHKSNINNTPSPFNCWNNTRGKYADSKDCRKFYICLGKLDPIIGSCPNNTVFSEINKQCTRNVSHCVRNNQFHCVYEGRFSDFIKDNTYYICVKYNRHFLRYKLQCEIGYHLNKATVKCEKNVENSSQSSSSVSENFQTTEKSENLDNKEDFECEQEGKFPYSKDCKKYYFCSKNKKNEYRRKIKKCSDDKVYDIEKEMCISAETNEC